jgi:exonuclease III
LWIVGGEDRIMRVVSWNIRRAAGTGPKQHAWSYLTDLEPDLVLLQEVGAIPESFRDQYSVLHQLATGRTGRSQRFGSALLVRHGPLTKVALLAPLTWVNDELARLGGFVLAGQANLLGAQTVVVSVHSPAWYLDRARLSLVEVGDVRLTQNADVWVADLVLAAIRALVAESRQVLVGGDFNLSPTFDAWRRGGHGNQEYLDRMATLGMVECLASFQGRLTPTFRNPRGGRVIHQIDHLFASFKLAKHLRWCDVPPAEEFFQRGLSDHLPIIADFRSSM